MITTGLKYYPRHFLNLRVFQDLVNELVTSDERFTNHFNHVKYNTEGPSREGRTLHLKRVLFRSTNSARIDIDVTKQYPNALVVLETLAGPHAIGRAYAHRLPAGAVIHEHNDVADKDPYFGYDVQRHILFLKGSGEAILDGEPIPTPIGVVCTFDASRLHSFKADTDWYFLVFDVLRVYHGFEWERVPRVDQPVSVNTQ